MKLHPDAPTSLNTITAYGDGFLEVNAQRHESAVWLMPEGLLESWPVTEVASIGAGHFESMLQHRPELVILGTGPRQTFLHPRLTAPLTSAGVGFEVMDSRAACRTYNILMAEGRRVLAAVLPP